MIKDTILQEFIVQTKGVTESYTQLDQLGKQLGKASAHGLDLNNVLSQKEAILGKNTLAMKVFNSSLEQTERHTNNMKRIGPMFAFLFGGMQLQRIGLSITRFVLPAMDKVENYTSRGTRQVNAMKASFEFLKFSIFETFTQTPLFQKFVELVISASNWLSEMVAKHPMLVQIAAVVGGVAVALGTLAIGAGIFNQFAMMASYLGVGKSVAGAPSLLKGITGLEKALLGLGLVAAVATITWGVSQTISNIKEGDLGGALVSGLGTVLGMAGLGGILLKKTAVGLAFVVASGIVLGINKITYDARQAVKARREVLGMDTNWFEDLSSGLHEGVLGQRKWQQSEELLALSQIESDIGKFYNNLENARQDFEKAEGSSNQIQAYDALINAQDEFNRLQENFLTITKGDYSTWQKMLFQEEAKRQELIEKVEETEAAQKSMFESAFPQYNEQLSLIAGNTEKTQDFSKNMDSLLDLFNSSEMQSGILNIQRIDELWIQAQESLSGFAKELDEWASKVVVKTVQIRYEESNRPSGTSGFFGGVGARVDSLISSVTGRSDG